MLKTSLSLAYKNMYITRSNINNFNKKLCIRTACKGSNLRGAIKRETDTTSVIRKQGRRVLHDI
jgi:hypothetical protein